MNATEKAAMEQALKTLRAIHLFWTYSDGPMTDTPLWPSALLLDDDQPIRNAVADAVNALEDHFPEKS